MIVPCNENNNTGLRPIRSDMDPKIGAPINWKIGYDAFNNPIRIID